MATGSKKGGFLKPEKIIRQVGVIKPGMIVADFGSGSGYFTIPIAKIVGKDGKVYAFDVLEDPLKALRSKAELEGVFNIETKRVNLEAPQATGLRRGSQDCVLLSNILFQTQEKESIIKEALRVLSPGGFLVLIAWEPDTAFGPTGGWRISEQDARQLLEEQGLEHYKDFPGGQYHYGLVYKK